MKKYNKIEDMPEKELKKLIKETYDKPLSKIKPIPYIGKIDQQIQYKSDEVVALCPMTGILDLYSLTIRFIPNRVIPELKTLKFYLLDYSTMRISHEHLAAKIFKDFDAAIKPKKLMINLDVAIRGGIKTDIMYEK